MENYTKFMKWAVVYMIDRKTQDSRKSRPCCDIYLTCFLVYNIRNIHIVFSTQRRRGAQCFLKF